MGKSFWCYRCIRKEIKETHPCKECDERYSQNGKYNDKPESVLFFLVPLMTYLIHSANDCFYAGHRFSEFHACMRQTFVHMRRNHVHCGSDTGVCFLQMPALYHASYHPCKYVQTYRKLYYTKHRERCFVKFSRLSFSKMRDCLFRNALL